MEKYRDWTDLGTGVNPFVPPYKSQTFGIRMFSYTLGIPIAILKLLTFTLLFVVLGLSSILMALVGVIPVLGRMVQRLTDKCLARAMLVMLGVFVIQEKKLGHYLHCLTHRFTYCCRCWPITHSPATS